MRHRTSSAGVSFAEIPSATHPPIPPLSCHTSSSSSSVSEEEEMDSERSHRPFRSRRKGHGPSTGLRAVTMLVVQMLRQQSALSYEAIANDVCNQLRTTDEVSEARNIRRRAYDVINVMAAVGYIKKHKKRLFSVQSFVDANGAVSMDILAKEKSERMQRIAEKEARIQCVLQQSIDQQIEQQRQQQENENRQREKQNHPDEGPAVVMIKQEEDCDADMSEQPADNKQMTTLSPVPAGDDIIPDAAFISFPDSEPYRPGNVVVQQMEYLYTPYEYFTGNYMISADADACDPNLQEASGSRQLSHEIESQYNRDPVEAIISSFY